MDGQGDLDADGEQRLRDNAKDITRRTVQDQLLKENSGARESTLEAQYNRLRQASHNPQDIETPQDMMIAMLTVKGTRSDHTLRDPLHASPPPRAPDLESLMTSATPETAEAPPPLTAEGCALIVSADAAVTPPPPWLRGRARRGDSGADGGSA